MKCHKCKKNVRRDVRVVSDRILCEELGMWVSVRDNCDLVKPEPPSKPRVDKKKPSKPKNLKIS